MYKVGDTVWYASFGTREEEVPCPVCYGNKSVIVILGNGDNVEVECQYCQRGFNSPSGYIVEYIALPRVEQVTIAKRTIEEACGGEEIEYVGNNYHTLYPDRMFDQYDEALAHANWMAEQDSINKSNNSKFKNEKSYTWNAGYHLKQAEKCHKEAIHHEEKAKLCKARSKDK